MTLRSPLLLLTVLTLIACGDETSGGDVMATITATELTSDTLEEGVEVCITNFDGYGCATTDEMGATTMMVPANADVLFRFSKEGSTYIPSISPVSTPDTDFHFEGELVDRILAQVLASGVGTEIDPTKGTVFLSAGGPNDTSGQDGYVFDVMPSIGDGLFYFDESATPDLELTATTNTGAGAAVNLDPGTYTFSYSPPDSRRCFFESGWRTSDTTGSFPIEAGAITVVGLEDCE